MRKPVVIITGCGYKPAEHIYKFKGKPTHSAMVIEGKECKMNIGSATAYYLSKQGIEVIMVSRNEDNLAKIKRGLLNMGCKEDLISFFAADLTTKEGIDTFVEHIPKGRQLYWVQAIGMGGGAYKIPNDNIYLPFEEISPEIIKQEANIVPATHMLLLKLIGRFREQIKRGDDARICIITSMSGERGYHFGATHVAAKHALVGWIKGIRNELEDEGIKIFDIRPGAIDTGMYDNEHVRKNVEEISRRTGMWGGKGPIYESPISVAKKIYAVLFGKNTNKIQRVLAPFQK